MFPDWERRILSKPIPVHWAGFESNTYRLQQAGWEFTAEQCFERMATRLMMRHKQYGMYGCTDLVDTDFFADQHTDHWRSIFFPVQWMTGGQVQIMRITDNFTTMRPVDMQPSVVTEKWEDIEDAVLFGAPLVRTNELIIEPDDVNTLMERILTLQKPGAQEHYKNALREMRRGGSAVEGGLRPQQQFHAQVISLVA